MWDWSSVPLYHMEEVKGKYVIYQHAGFGDMMFCCECRKKENAEAILEILYKDLEEKDEGINT